MKVNRTKVTVAIAGLGLAGLGVAGGAGIVAAANAAPPTTPMTSSMSGPHHGAGMSGMIGMSRMAMDGSSPMTAAASYLGLSQTELQTQLQAGKTLADVAKAQGKSVPSLESAMVAAITSHIDANSTLTADQKQAMLNHAKSQVDTMVNATHAAGAGMSPMGAMGAWMGGRGR